MGLGNLFGGNSNGDPKTVAHSVKIVRDSTGAPAVDLSKVASTGGVNLEKKTKAAVDSLANQGLAGLRAQVMVIVDHSGSMYGFYSSGLVQNMVERFLGFGLAVDVDGEIPVIPFDFRAKSAVDVNMNNYHNVVQDKIFKSNSMGTTNLTDALEKVRDAAKKTDAPLYVAIVTDGNPDDKRTARNLIIDLARYPVFIKFLAVAPVSFLEELDDMDSSERLLDNVDTKAYRDISSVTDEQFAKDMADEWDGWVKAATAAGILTNG